MSSQRQSSSFRWVAIGLGLALLLTTAAEVRGDDASLDDVPEAYRAGVRRALRGGNGAALRAAYDELDEEERQGWAFLLTTMRPHVVSRLTEPLLTEHVEYAYRARRELTWAKELPEEIFLHYVLPILSGDEPLQQWRKRFFDEVVPVLKKKRIKDLEKAALEVNKWCGSRVTFKPTPAEDAGPLDTLERGYGRCEEEGIFYIAVARSVGVPARMASTPYWTFKASNHAWCEVYTGKTGKRASRAWGFLGACEPSGKLNEAWFKGDVKRAAVVLSRAIGAPAGDEVLSSRGGYSVINSTRYYTKTCRMTLRAADEAGELTFDLGPGDYVVHARKGDAAGCAIATSAPGKAATCEIVLGEPAPDEGSPSEPGTSGVQLDLGPGGKKTTVGLCPLDAFPWKPSRSVQVDDGGVTVDLAAGTWMLQTGRRKGDGEVHVVLHAFVVEEGRRREIRLPGPKPPRRRKRDATGPVLTVLTYPRG